jgi:hypothetical protein
MNAATRFVISAGRSRLGRWPAPFGIVIACGKREAFAQGREATKQSIYPRAEKWIASLRSQ